MKFKENMKKDILFLFMAVLFFQLFINIKEVKASDLDSKLYMEKEFNLKFNNYEQNKMTKADGWKNGKPFNCTWDKDNITFSNSIMNLWINNGLRKGTYTGAEYRSKDVFGFGYYKVNMKPIKNDGIVSSFFIYTGPKHGTQWDEIDIEFLGKDTSKVQFNYYTNGVGKNEFIYDLGFDASEDFHTYEIRWLKDSIRWYVDGKEVHKATENIPQTPGKIMMNVWPGIGVDKWLNPYDGKVPLNAQYSWVYYYGKYDQTQIDNYYDIMENQ